ncbi:GspH/FimT family pseudopilin [Thalassotalea sp. PLHSN55]|uniref:GspH/FimT family pseudopilin n=1 Tax=Thalassotalea sp. PLHSN55 TaxID=3435888 RepID=UPI003F83F495
MHKSKGLTLIELMVTIAIVAILTTLSVTSLSGFLIETRVDNEISQLHRLLLSARNFAINSGRNVTVCPLNSANACSTQWQEPISVFIDLNNNQLFEPQNNELAIKVKSAIREGDQLIYAKYRNKVVYQPTGQLSGLSNGTFRYCPKGFQEKSRGIIVARSGRLYMTTDIDHDGQDEKRQGGEIVCQ